LSLLKGPSGIGKSTILQAITWCLYGKIIRGTDAKNSKSGKSFVQLEYKGVKVYRQKRPNTVTFTNTDGKMYESEIAESMIDNHFGNSVLWNAVGYIQQGDLNKLLSANNSDRMELLNTLAFDGMDNSEKHIERVSEVLKETELRYMIAEKSFNDNLKAYSVALESGINTDKIYTDARKILAAEQRLTQIKGDINILNQKIGVHRAANAKILSVQQALDKLSPFNPNDIPKLNSQISEHKEQISNVNSEITQITLSLERLFTQKRDILAIDKVRARLTQIDQELLQLKVDTTDSSPVDMMTIQQVHIQELEYKRHFDAFQTAKKMIPDLSYDVKNISDNVLLLETSDEVYRLTKRLDDINLKIANLNKTVTDNIVPETLNEVTAKLETLRRNHEMMNISFNELRCPHCTKSVKYDALAKVLKVGSSSDIFTHQQLQDNLNEINKYTGYLQKYQVKIKAQQEINLSESDRNLTLNKINGRSAGDIKHEMIPLLLQILKGIKIVEVPKVSSSSLITKSKYQLLHSEKKQILESNRMTTSDLKTQEEILTEIMKLEPRKTESNIKKKYLEVSIEQLQQHINTSMITNQQRQNLQRELADNTLLLAPTVEQDLQNVINEELTIKKNLEETKKYNALIGHRERLEEEKKALEVINNKKLNLNRMKELAIQCECYQLSVLVDSLNTAIASIASYLFDLPIIIKLNLFKTVKTTQRVKPSVNLTVNYKGFEYDNINMLSGGERDRVSLCITLAMNQISGCPFLFLDEVIGTLDAGMTETAIKSIKIATAGKTCLLVSHSAVEGVFQDVISLGT
jgi:DNA repair exonuclease SbcCD ATPase subunit